MVDGKLFGTATNIFSIYADPEIKVTWEVLCLWCECLYLCQRKAAQIEGSPRDSLAVTCLIVRMDALSLTLSLMKTKTKNSGTN